MSESPKLVDSILQPKEGAESQERTAAELKVPDPKPEKVLGVLTGQLAENGNEPKAG